MDAEAEVASTAASIISDDDVRDSASAFSHFSRNRAGISLKAANKTKTAWISLARQSNVYYSIQDLRDLQYQVNKQNTTSTVV